MLFVIAPVRQGVVAKRDVADCEVEEAVRKIAFLKAPDVDVGFWVKLLGDPARYAVQLHAVEFGCRHALRQETEKVAHAAGGFQDISSAKAHILYYFINCADNRGTRKMGVQRGSAGGSVFFWS